MKGDKPEFTTTRHQYAGEDVDPYEAQGKNFRVHHPTQPKTQVEKWREEVKENQRIITECACGGECQKKGTDNCRDRMSKIYQLYELIAQATQSIYPRYPTGEFADDKKHTKITRVCGNIIVFLVCIVLFIVAGYLGDLSGKVF